MSTDGFVIRQPAGQRTLALRESYLAICEVDACEAQILNAQERWYAYKLAEREQNRGKNRSAQQGGEGADADESLWVRMDAKGWARELLNIYNEKTVRVKLASLVGRGFLETRSNPKRKWDRTPQWLFKRQAVQAAVDAWEATRVQPDLDPVEEENDDSAHSDDHSDKTTNSTRTNVRIDSDKVPNASGESSGSSRTNVRSNNTGILTQGSSTGIPPQTSSSTLTGQEDASSSDDDDQTADAGTPLVGQASPPTGGAATAPARHGLTQVLDTTQNPATGTETVPPAAAAGGSAILALTPIPRAELEGRSARDPARMVQLRALLSASHKSRLPHLEAELALATRSGVPRHLLTRLTDPELAQATAAARADAGLVEGGFTKAGVHALHRLIGEPLTLDTLKGQRTPVDDPPLGRAYEVKNAGQAPVTEESPSSAEGRLRPGALWRHKKTMEVVLIRSVSNFQFTLSNDQTVKADELNRQYEFESSPREASA